MGRVAIIGNAGGGKTTLSLKLGKRQGLCVYPLDKIQWKPHWQPAPLSEVREKHDEILSTEKWIIDGWGTWDLITRRFEAADTIIFIDFPLALHYRWAFKRQFKSIFVPRADLPENCPMLPKTLELVRLMWMIHRQMRPRLKSMVESFKGRKLVIEIRSIGDLRRFAREYC
jgi:adenylate kinase family enzyme